MAIKRNSCRTSERKRMRELSAQGYSIPQISNAVSVKEPIVTLVVNGSWAEAEKEGKAQLKANETLRAGAAHQAKIDDAALVATAVAQAISDSDEQKETQGQGKKSAAK